MQHNEQLAAHLERREQRSMQLLATVRHATEELLQRLVTKNSQRDEQGVEESLQAREGYGFFKSATPAKVEPGPEQLAAQTQEPPEPDAPPASPLPVEPTATVSNPPTQAPIESQAPPPPPPPPQAQSVLTQGAKRTPPVPPPRTSSLPKQAEITTESKKTDSSEILAQNDVGRADLLADIRRGKDLKSTKATKGTPSAIENPRDKMLAAVRAAGSNRAGARVGDRIGFAEIFDKAIIKKGPIIGSGAKGITGVFERRIKEDSSKQMLAGQAASTSNDEEDTWAEDDGPLQPPVKRVDVKPVGDATKAAEEHPITDPNVEAKAEEHPISDAIVDTKAEVAHGIADAKVDTKIDEERQINDLLKSQLTRHFKYFNAVHAVYQEAQGVTLFMTVEAYQDMVDRAKQKNLEAIKGSVEALKQQSAPLAAAAWSVEIIDLPKDQAVITPAATPIQQASSPEALGPKNPSQIRPDEASVIPPPPPPPPLSAERPTQAPADRVMASGSVNEKAAVKKADRIEKPGQALKFNSGTKLSMSSYLAALSVVGRDDANAFIRARRGVITQSASRGTDESESDDMSPERAEEFADSLANLVTETTGIKNARVQDQPVTVTVREISAGSFEFLVSISNEANQIFHTKPSECNKLAVAIDQSCNRFGVEMQSIVLTIQ
jgi:hypothetical protein